MIKESRILILEDQPTDAELEIRELRRAQLVFEVKRVETKETFLEALEEFKPDIIISDYALPQFNGLEALRLLKELDNDIPFILCTGTPTEEVAVECMKEGAADYVLKTSLKRLPSAVLNALESRDARRAKEEAFDALRRMNEELERRVEQRTAELVETNLSLQEEIAERQCAEAALQRREKELTDFVDNATIGLHWVDGNGIILWTNKAELDLLGYAPEEYIGHPIADFHADNEVIGDVLQRLTANEELHDYEARLRCKDGSIKYVLINSNVYWEDGKFAHTRCFTRDITERRNAEEALRRAHDELETRVRQRTAELVSANELLENEITEREQAQEKLRESEEWLKALLDASRDGIVVEDDGNIVYINQSYARQLKYNEPEELIGRHIADILPPDEAERLSEFGRRRLRGENPPSVYQFTGLCKDGTTIEVEGAVSSYVIGGKKYIMTALRDITERKLAEEQLKAKEAQLVEAQRIAQVGSWTFDLDNKTVIWSDEMFRIMGYKLNEIVPTYEIYLGLIHPDDLDFVVKDHKKMLRERGGFSHVHRLTSADDTMHYLAANAQATINEKGKVIKITGTAQDITERKRANEALQESEYKMRTLLGNMNEGLLQVDTADSIEFVNNRFCGMLGYSSPDELVGKIWSQLTLDDDERKFIKAVNKRRRQGISDSYELQMRKKTGEKIWVLVGGAPMVNAEGITTGSMGVFTDITERKRAEEQMLHDAFHDNLTGLANRTLFMEHLHLTIERGKRRVDAAFAVLFLDFDRFKVINDSLGHAEGDKLLMQIARRLETSLRPGDLAARLGGDEFTILLPELDEESDALRIAERIQENLKGAFALAGREIFTSASIGIALSTAGHTQAEDMLRDADIAMYRAKAKGKAQFQVFDQEMHKDALAQMQLETEMRHALERGEFLLHYQPIINLETNNLMGFEALVRWKHPTRGMVPPMEFIPAAEETGLILALGKWILNESCRQMRQWQIGNPAAESLTVSVNLSSKQFQQPDLAEQVAAALDAAGLNPCCLKLEITESHIMENTESAIAMMNRLRNLGTEISLDDFGTGYSSLSYLHRFPVDYLKIDRSFVTRMAENTENAEIVHTIIKLAQNLKMKVVAEGIETAEQLDQLQQLNCEYGQGYFFSKPLEAEAASLFIGGGIINSAPVSNLSPVNFKLIG